MPAPQVFISYRRDDSAGYARALYDALARQFGDARVFIDVDDIGAGQPFTAVLEQAVGGTRVLLVLIGPRWQGPREGAAPRLHDPADMVHREVLAGLRNGARVIPVLLDGTPMPGPAALPPALQALSGRNALELGATRYTADIQRLVQAVREALGEPAPAPGPRRLGRPAVALGLALLLAAAGTGLWWRQRPMPAAVAVAPRPAINGLWQAEVVYDWPGARYTEQFDLRGEAGALHGSASFLGVARGVLEGRVDADGSLQFVTRTTETVGASSAETTHRYRGRQVGDALRLVMQTEGGSTAHQPIEFVARRVGRP
jgi:hypothetical protein